MTTYAVLLRGINVGGRNAVPMAGLRQCLEGLGFSGVSSYIASGNVVLQSDQTADQIRAQVEAALASRFHLDDALIRVLVMTRGQLEAVVVGKPEGFGEEPDTYHCDAIFLIGLDAVEAMTAFEPREGVDRVWAGEGVIYSQRLTALRTKSRLGQVMGTPAYKSMTIRNWRTTTALLELARQTEDR